MSEVVVYATLPQAATVRAVLVEACRATGLTVRLELFGSGSLVQRLKARRAPPFADVILWSGPYAAQFAAAHGLLQRHQPAALPERAIRHPDWLWSAVEFQPFRITGATTVGGLDDLTTVPRVALADPERSEVGLMLLVAMLDRARQQEGDADSAWTWWAQRARMGIRLVDDDEAALAAVRANRASHAVTLGDQGSPITGLAPVPCAIALAANAPNEEQGRQLVDWLVGPSAPASTRLSAWRAAADGLDAVLAGAPRLDVGWGTQQYTPARRRWAQSGFGPNSDSL